MKLIKLNLMHFRNQIDEYISSVSSDKDNPSQFRKKMPRTEAIKKLWGYIKKHKWDAKKMMNKK